MEKTFSVIRCPNKDYLYRVNYAKDSSVLLREVYNNIGDSYMGTMIEGFIGSVRGLLRTVPDFFEIFDEHDSKEKQLQKLGFKEIEPSEFEIKLAHTLNPA